VRLEDIRPNIALRGVLPDCTVSVVSVRWHGANALSMVYRTTSGRVAEEVLYREDEQRLEPAESQHWSFGGDGHLFRLVSEAHRIRMAHLFDPMLAVHTSLVEPLPHQISAVYEVMLPRQPLRFLLADDPGAGKTIMAGLLIKEMMLREDLRRCLIVCPGGLAEQWQDELHQRFHLPFEILTNDKLESARTGNWFLENDLAIARLDKLARDERLHDKLRVEECRYDLIVCDEAHKLSATFFGGEVKYTKRYRLGQLLSGITRHFLLLTATPHNGKEEDFQLFMALLDSDRFEGRFRDGVHRVDVSDLMRRVDKESLLRFDGTPLFPERIAYTVPFRLSPEESELYSEVTAYVREEFNRADALANNKRAGTVGFALTILQRRLASSPEAIYQSLRRRRERLEKQLLEMKDLRMYAEAAMELDPDELEELEDAPESEMYIIEQDVLGQATAARTTEELRAEIDTLRRLEDLAKRVRASGKDSKWVELSRVLSDVFDSRDTAFRSSSVSREKLVIFTEHRDTLSYLADRIRSLFGRYEAVVTIHGGMKREERRRAQEIFLYDPEVRVLVATDAAGEGINLQRAHLMVNYDLPWNPNRIEQRFGRIHRIGQTEVCHLWNLVAEDTREGDVYQTLLDKLDQARQSLGGRVFDVLGKLQFDGKSLKELLIDAIRYGDMPEVRARITRAIEGAVDRERLMELIEERALARDVMDVRKVARIREEMERAEARRLQPHYIESFFLEAFQHLGGAVHERESRRYEIRRVPASILQHARAKGAGGQILDRYERVVFEKELIAPQGMPRAAFLCPGHPLLDTVIDLILEKHRDILRMGAVLVDDRDTGTEPRVVFYMEHAIQDASTLPSGERRIVSKRMLYVEIDRHGNLRTLNQAPYLDLRPLAPDEPSYEEILATQECAWIDPVLEQRALEYAIDRMVPEHLNEVRARRLEMVERTRAAVRERLTKEIAYWDHQSEKLKLQERAGKAGARLNSQEARKRADELQARLDRRMRELDMEKQISALQPVIIGGFLVVPIGMIAVMRGGAFVASEDVDHQDVAARARQIVIDLERRLGYEPVDREAERLGYDIESRDPRSGRLRFIEVKGRATGARTLTVTRNEILTSLNKPDDYILAVVEFLGGGEHKVHYIRRPFRREPDFGVTSVNYDFEELLERGEEPA